MKINKTPCGFDLMLDRTESHQLHMMARSWVYEHDFEYYAYFDQQRHEVIVSPYSDTLGRFHLYSKIKSAMISRVIGFPTRRIMADSTMSDESEYTGILYVISFSSLDDLVACRLKWL